MSRLSIKKMDKERKGHWPDQPGDQQPANEFFADRREVSFLDLGRLSLFVQAFMKSRKGALRKLFESDKKNNG